MKQILFLTLSAMLIFSSCSKDDDSKKDDSVTINGQSYPTVKIGPQTWTTINYNGAGGVNYNDGANDPAVGKLYSFTEVKSISALPDGWRIPSEDDVKKLMAYVTTQTDSRGDVYINEAICKKLISTSGWDPANLNGSNSTGLNIKPVGYYSKSGAQSVFEWKGFSGSFWTSSKSEEGAEFFEIANLDWEDNSTVMFRGYIFATTLLGESNTLTENRPIRFVKDN